MLEALSSSFNQSVSINGSSDHQWMHHSVKILAVFIGACLIHNLWKKKLFQSAENVCELGVLKVVSYTIDTKNLEEIGSDIQEENQNLELQVDELKKNNAELKNTAANFSETTAKIKKENDTLKQSIEQLRENRIAIEKITNRLEEFTPRVQKLSQDVKDLCKAVNRRVELGKEEQEASTKAFNTEWEKIEEQFAILEQQRQEEQARHEKVMSSIPVKN